MNAEFQQEPSSVSEFAAGAIALAAVALITYVGAQSSPPATSPTLASRSSETTASIAAAAPPPAATPGAAAPVEPAPPPVATDSAVAAGPSMRPGIPPFSEAGRVTAASPPSLDPVVEYSPAPLTNTNPLVTDGVEAARAGAPGQSRPYDAVRAQPPNAATEMMAARTEPERDLVNRFDVISIQTKLRELGYYVAESDGVWGPGARRALRDFRIMNGLQENDQWDRETEERLWSGRGVPAASTFIGSWGRNAAECRAGEDRRIKIDSHRAESSGAKCDFRSVNQEASGKWQVRALCSAAHDTWTANISLTLTGSNLRWSSERGTETYLRCPRR